MRSAAHAPCRLRRPGYPQRRTGRMDAGACTQARGDGLRLSASPVAGRPPPQRVQRKRMQTLLRLQPVPICGVDRYRVMGAIRTLELRPLAQAAQPATHHH
ncbi:hypothetical protein XFF6994_5240018 [Xanthomonas citri pv. fuscans]|nr:hypothetical protein XFF6994_5240018 [Xanthomonas citri pv. fuscans]